jgi:stage II sporulation protein D
VILDNKVKNMSIKKRLIFSIILCITILNHPPVTARAAELPIMVRVGLESKYREADSVPVRNTLISVGYGNAIGQFIPYAEYQASGGFIVRPDSASREQVALYDGNTLIAVFESAIQIKDANGGPVSLGNPGTASYRGVVEVGRYTGNKLTAVNILEMDEYLYGVVPAEMSPSFQPEALKAQAVASRTYALSHMGAHKDAGYDLCDQGHCHVYAGMEKEHEATSRAVHETAGQVAYYNGQPINAVYFASSGGVTEDAANVWVSDVPYLKSVREINEYEPRIWTRSFTLNEITRLLTANNINIGMATAVGITRTAPSGRVLELTVYGTSGNKVLAKEEVRTFFSSSAGGSLESRNFTINDGISEQPVGTPNIDTPDAYVTVTDGGTAYLRTLDTLYAVSASGIPVPLQSAYAYDGKNAVIYYETSDGNATATSTISSGSSVTFAGRGWGHGAGMSQRGAEGMARLGYDYITILKYYYTGITVW